MRSGGRDGTSLQGRANKVVVIFRDWLSDLDRDVLPAVRDEYDQQRNDEEVAGTPSVAALLRAQRDSITVEIASLPSH